MNADGDFYSAPGDGERSLLIQAMHLHRAGNLDGAERLYQRVLEINPQHADALNLLGTVKRQRGRLSEAVELISKAISLRPRSADYHLNLGEACRALGRLERAVEAYEAVLQIRPNELHARRALASSYAGLGQMGRAIDTLKNAIAIDRSFALAYEDLAGFLAQTGDFARAIDACNTAISLSPQRASSYYKLGAVLTKKQDFLGAINAYKRAIELGPDWPQPLAGLAQAYVLTGSYALAENAAHRALELDPSLAPAQNHLGLALAWQGKLTQAIQSYLRAIEIDPSRVETRANLASVRLQVLDQPEAISLYRRALQMKPDDLGLASNLLFARNYVTVEDERELFEEHRQWGNRLVASCPRSSPGGLEPGRGAPGRPLRVGYVSPDLCDHPVARFIEPILRGHRRSVIEPVVYNDTLRRDQTTQHLKGLVSEWHDVAQISDAELAERIKRDEIDILIDLAGHTARNRLRMFVLKPASVQITYLGYPNTTGLPPSIMNYRLTDALCDPPGDADALHTEKLLRLPAPFLCHLPPSDAPEPSGTSALRAGPVTFGCFNAMAKITTAMIARWSEILRRVNDSRILLKNRSLGDELLRERVRAEFARHSISENRVSLCGHEPTERGHLSRYQEVDIALDTFPYHGTTTTCEALWMGVPVITLAGSTHRSRVGASLLTAVGLEMLVARDIDEYMAIAVEIAERREWLSDLKNGGLRGRMEQSPLRDEAGFVSALEETYLQLLTEQAARSRA